MILHSTSIALLSLLLVLIWWTGVKRPTVVITVSSSLCCPTVKMSSADSWRLLQMILSMQLNSTSNLMGCVLPLGLFGLPRPEALLARSVNPATRRSLTLLFSPPPPLRGLDHFCFCCRPFRVNTMHGPVPRSLALVGYVFSLCGTTVIGCTAFSTTAYVWAMLQRSFGRKVPLERHFDMIVRPTLLSAVAPWREV